MLKPIESDIYSCERFARFRDLLEKNGFSIRCIFESRTDDKHKYPDVIGFRVIGTPEKPPEVGTFIVRNYGEDGYGIWFDRNTGTMQEDLWHIAGATVPKPRTIVAIGPWCWGIGATVLEALANAKEEGEPDGEAGKPCYEVFDAPEGTTVGEMGGLTWPMY